MPIFGMIWVVQVWSIGSPHRWRLCYIRFHDQGVLIPVPGGLLVHWLERDPEEKKSSYISNHFKVDGQAERILAYFYAPNFMSEICESFSSQNV